MGHEHGTTNYGRVFAIGIALNFAFVVAETIFGFWSNSLALLSDAGHNLSDVLGLAIAWIGHSLGQIRPSQRRTYGWRGSTILAALTNSLLLLTAILGICWEAIRRFSQPAEVAGMTVVVVAAVGVIVNSLAALLFLRGQKEDLNLRGAFLHMAADAAVSLGVVTIGLAIQFTGWNWLDPASSIAISLVIFLSTWGLLRESVNLAMQAVPEGIDPGKVETYLATLPGVTQVHDLHIWAMSTTEVALTAHLVKPTVENEDPLLLSAQKELHDRFGIEHVTLQIERSEDPEFCVLAPPESL
ncbi:MAG: cation diffusion facilitator family transporter [Planctomycetota bacterium]